MRALEKGHHILAVDFLSANRSGKVHQSIHQSMPTRFKWKPWSFAFNVAKPRLFSIFSCLDLPDLFLKMSVLCRTSSTLQTCTCFRFWPLDCSWELLWLPVTAPGKHKITKLHRLSPNCLWKKNHGLVCAKSTSRLFQQPAKSKMLQNHCSKRLQQHATTNWQAPSPHTSPDKSNIKCNMSCQPLWWKAVIVSQRHKFLCFSLNF